MSVRKAHNAGRNHLRNVQSYYERTTSDPQLALAIAADPAV